MNHDNLVKEISALFPGLTTTPPLGLKVPEDQTSFWIPGLSSKYGRVVRIRRSDGRLKKAASARLLKGDEQGSTEAQFKGSLEDLCILLRREIELVRESTIALGIQFPMNLEAGDAKPAFKADEDDEREPVFAYGVSTDGAAEAPASRDWTDEELSATVDCYREMLSLVAAGTPFVKAMYYRQLSERFARVPGAFERRMQNISHLLVARGLDSLRGLKPQRNMGANVEPRLTAFLAPLFDELGPAPGFADELVEPAKVVEGAKKQVTVNAYERDSTAKARCINRWGTACVVCSFDFGAAYGDLGKGFIHVHHLRPIHAIGESYELDPENELRPVCPNCHSMLHRRKMALSIEELVGQLKWRFVAPPSGE